MPKLVHHSNVMWASNGTVESGGVLTTCVRHIKMVSVYTSKSPPGLLELDTALPFSAGNWPSLDWIQFLKEEAALLKEPSASSVILPMSDCSVWSLEADIADMWKRIWRRRPETTLRGLIGRLRPANQVICLKRPPIEGRGFSEALSDDDDKCRVDKQILQMLQYESHCRRS